MKDENTPTTAYVAESRDGCNPPIHDPAARSQRARLNELRQAEHEREHANRHGPRVRIRAAQQRMWVAPADPLPRVEPSGKPALDEERPAMGRYSLHGAHGPIKGGRG